MSLVRCFNIEIMRLMEELLIYLERWDSFAGQGYWFSTKDSNQELGPWLHFCSHLHKCVSIVIFSLFFTLLLPCLQQDRLPHSSVLNCNEVHPVNSTLIMSALSAPHWFFLFNMDECFACRHFCVPHVCLVPTKTTGRNWIPWDWSYRWL